MHTSHVKAAVILSIAQHRQDIVNRSSSAGKLYPPLSLLPVYQPTQQQPSSLRSLWRRYIHAWELITWLNDPSLGGREFGSALWSGLMLWWVSAGLRGGEIISSLSCTCGYMNWCCWTRWSFVTTFERRMIVLLQEYVEYVFLVPHHCCLATWIVSI